MMMVYIFSIVIKVKIMIMITITIMLMRVVVFFSWAYFKKFINFSDSNRIHFYRKDFQ